MKTDAPGPDADEAASRAAHAAGVVVRELRAQAELERATALFDAIWAPHSGIGLDLLRALTQAGNYVAGAFDAGSGELLGACAGFCGPPSRAELHSHIAGVGPAGLGRSVGFALKVHQRAWCLRRQVDVIAWTYDPLIRRNAYFNLVKLGARPVEYLRNFYGVLDDVINGGTETDRVLVHWDLRSRLAAESSAGHGRAASFSAERERGALIALSAAPGGGPELAARPPVAVTAPFAAAAGQSAAGPGTAGGPGPRVVLVGVPADVESLRRTDPAAAAAWRSALRDALDPLLASGARVTGFDRAGWYVVERTEE